MESQQIEAEQLQQWMDQGGADENYLNGMALGDELTDREPARLALELDYMNQQMQGGEAAVEAFIDAYETIKGSESLRAVECEALMAMCNHVRRSYAFKPQQLSFESHKEKRPLNVRMACEGIWTTVKDIMSAIASMLRRFATWLGDFFGALFGGKGGGGSGGGGSKSSAKVEAKIEKVATKEKAAPPAVRKVMDVLERTNSVEQAVTAAVAISEKEFLANADNEAKAGISAARIALAAEIKEKLARNQDPFLLKNYPYLSIHGKDYLSGNKGSPVSAHIAALKNLEVLAEAFKQDCSRAAVDSTMKAIEGAIDLSDVEEHRKAIHDVHFYAWINDYLDASKQPAEFSTEIDGEIEVIQFNPRFPGDYNLQVTRPKNYHDPDVVFQALHQVDLKVARSAHLVEIAEDEPLHLITDMTGLQKLAGTVTMLQKKFLEQDYKYMEESCKKLADKADKLGKQAEAENVSGEIGHFARGIVAAFRQLILQRSVSTLSYLDSALKDMMRYYHACADRHEHLINILKEAIDSKSMRSYLDKMQ